MMTEEQFQILARYEDNLRTAMTRKWARHPGTTAVKTIYAILTDLTGPRPRLNAMCQSCVLATLSDAGKLYFAEKERREKEAEAPQEAETEAVKPKAKKVSTKKPKASKIEK